MRVTVVVDAVDVVVTVETCDDAAVADLKAAVACEMDGDPNIALEGVVTKDGQILRDDQSLRANGVAQDDVLRVVTEEAMRNTRSNVPVNDTANARAVTVSVVHGGSSANASAVGVPTAAESIIIDIASPSRAFVPRPSGDDGIERVAR